MTSPICPQCGTSLSEAQAGATSCPSCGKSLVAANVTPAPVSPAAQAVVNQPRRGLIHLLLIGLKDVLLAFWRWFWKAMAGATILFTCLLTYIVATAPPPSPPRPEPELPLLTNIVISFVHGLIPAFWVGLAAGILGVVLYFVRLWLRLARRAESEPVAGLPWYQRLLWFGVADLHGLFRAFWKPCWKVAVGVALLLFLLQGGWVVKERFTAPSEHATLGGQLIMALIISLFLAPWPGLVVGLVCASWRLSGPWTLIAMVLIPGAVVLSVWLCREWIATQWLEALEAFVSSLETKGIPLTETVVEGGGKGLHGMPLEILPVVIAFLLALVLLDLGWAALDLDFLWQLLQAILTLVLAIAMGFVPSTLLSLVVVSFSVVSRMKARFQRFVAANGQTAVPTGVNQTAS